MDLLARSRKPSEPAVLESAAIGVKDEKWGERPLLFVVLKPEHKGKVGNDDLKQFMAKFAEQGKLAKYAVPGRFELGPKIIGRIPMRRADRPEEIGPLTVYLASDQASFVTGEIFFISGGDIAR